MSTTEAKDEVRRARQQLDEAKARMQAEETAGFKEKAEALKVECRTAKDEYERLEREFKVAEVDLSRCETACARIEGEIALAKQEHGKIDFPRPEEEAEHARDLARLQRELGRARKARDEARGRTGTLRWDAIKVAEKANRLAWAHRNAKARARGDKFEGYPEGGVATVG